MGLEVVQTEKLKSIFRFAAVRYGICSFEKEILNLGRALYCSVHQ